VTGGRQQSTDTVGGDLPLPLGGGRAAATGTLDSDFDVFVAGLAMNLHITRDQPYQRETAEWRKQQLDTSPEAGEQTLSTWWLRSQMSFHGGAGVKYLDTTSGEQNSNHIRYDTSRGIDVWTQGVVRRLPDTVLASATSTKSFLVSAQSAAGESYLIYNNGNALKANRLNANDTITYTVTGMAGTIKSLVVDGTNYYVASSDGHVFSGPIDNSTPGVAKWDFVSSSDVTLGWVKQRLMAAIDNKIYELAGTGPALPTVLYTHPNAGWRWSAFSESPDAVLAAGVAGLNSAIFAFTLSDASGTPVLTPGVSIAELPVGETVQSLYLYVGSRLAIGTTAGLRVGNFDNTYGTFTYGPLSVQTSSAVTAITGRGPFVYAGTKIDGEASLIRLDLGTAVEDGPIYAYAPDLRTPSATATGVVDGLTVRGDGKLAFTVRGYGLVRETDTYGARDAWLRTSKLRFNTVEPKQFKYGRIRSTGVGTITVSVETDTTVPGEVFTRLTAADSERFSLQADGGAEWAQLTFDFTEDAVLTSYQVMALPAQPRQRLFSVPVQLFDSEKNRHGRTIGYPGRSKELLDTLERIESSGDEITVQCPVLGIDAVRCTVERITFAQPSAPPPGKSYGLGGYAQLVFRTST
jgi:hypothetical protein